jgi:ABC-2 type transport system ATP-binding protein
MDEPTRSLDPATSLTLRKFVHDELSRGEGKTILLATHDLREAEAISDRIAILVRGRVRQIGTLSEVRRWGMREQLHRLEVDPVPDRIEGPFRALEDVTDGGVRRLTVALEEGARLDDLLRSLIGAGIRIRVCDRIEPDLEEAFSRILESETKDA